MRHGIKGEGEMERKAISVIMLLISLLSISLHSVLVKAEPSFIDIRILDVTATPTTVCVGDIVNITVAYEIIWENVEVEQWPGIKIYADAMDIGTIYMIIMGSGHTFETIDCEWNTADVEPGSYMISAIVYGDSDPIGNWFIFGPIRVLPSIMATVDIDPDTLNLRSKGKWISAYIELPEGYNVGDINATTILLNGTVPAETQPTAIGDYDEDGVPDLMVKLSRAEVVSLILNNVDVEQLLVERFVYVTLTVTGELYDGTPFQGSDTIGVIYLGYRGAFYRALSQMLREHKIRTEKLLI